MVVYGIVFTPVEFNEIKRLWRSKIPNVISYINSTSGYTRDQLGDNNEYGNHIGYSGITGTTQINPILSYEFYIDNNGEERIKFISYKYGPNDCTIMDNFDFMLIGIGDNDRVDCKFSGGTASYEPYLGCIWSGIVTGKQTTLS